MKESINIIKTNNMFYNVYNIDSYIFNLLFGYKVLNNNKVGFPISVINKIINVLEENHINYNITYLNKEKDNIYKDFKKLNNYNKFKDKALENMDRVNKINYVIERINNCSNDKLDKLLFILCEYFK